MDDGMLINRLLSGLPDCGVVGQLRSRQVSAIWLVNLWKLYPGGDSKDVSKDVREIHGGLHYLHSRIPPPFEFWLNEDDTIEEWTVTVGHELCHVMVMRWEIADMGRYVFDYWTDLCKDGRDEKFCDKFAYQWFCQGENYIQLKDLFIKKFLNQGNMVIPLAQLQGS